MKFILSNIWNYYIVFQIDCFIILHIIKMEFPIINHYNESFKNNKIEISDYSKDKLNIIINIIKTDKVINIDDCFNRNLLMFHGIYYYNLYCNFLNTQSPIMNIRDYYGYFRNTKKYFKKAIKNGNKKALLKFALLLANNAKNNNWSNSRKKFYLKQTNKYFLKAIDNKVKNSLLEYALFLQSIKKVNKANKYFQKALELEENKFNILLNYAIFLDTDLFPIKDFNKINNLYKTMEKIELFELNKITKDQRKKFYFNYAIYCKRINNKEKYIEYLEKGYNINSIDCIDEFISDYYNINLSTLSNEEYCKLKKYNLKLIDLEDYFNCDFYAKLLQAKKRQSDVIIHYYELGIKKLNSSQCMNNLAVYYLENNYQNLDKIENLLLDTIYLGEKSGVDHLYNFYKKYHSKEKAHSFIKSFFSDCKYKNYGDISEMQDIALIFMDKFIDLKNITNIEKYIKLKKAINYVQIENHQNFLTNLENNDIHVKIYNIKKKIKKRYYQCDICYEKKNCIPSNCFSDHYICYDCYFIQYDKPCHMCRYYNQDFNSVYIIAKNLIDRIVKLDNENKSLELDNAYLALDIENLRK